MPCLRRLESLACHRGGPGSVPGQSMWDLVGILWHWDRFCSESRVSCVIIPVQCTPLHFLFIRHRLDCPSTGHTLHMRNKTNTKLHGAGHEKVDRTNSRPQVVVVLTI